MKEQGKKQAEEFDFTKDAGLGMEGMTAADIAIPFIAILQKLSPQVDSSDERHVEGAKAGMLFNTVTNEAYDTEATKVLYAPAYYRRMFPEWKDRSKGGGFVAQHDDPTIMSKGERNERGQIVLPNGNLIVETAYYFGMLILEGRDPSPAVIAMSSTQWKAAKQWNAIIVQSSRMKDGVIAPMYRCQYRLKTRLEKNDRGAWFGWCIEPMGFVSEKNTLETLSSFGRQMKSEALLLTNKSHESEDPGGEKAEQNPF